ncbi:MAG TPA: NAD(P)/FAD-dependent oxidoreductase [Pirellulales bacterium]|jgi:NADH dehydrogenase
MPNNPRVVILGGGFGGLNVAQSLRREPVDVTLIDRRNFHLFQPLLYQVATGGLSPANIAAPLRSVLKSQTNASVLLAEVTHIDVERQAVVLREDVVPYDVLIVATGSSHHYFGHPEWEQWAPSLKTVEDATEIRRRVLSAFEAAEREPDAASRATWLTFLVVGGGPTGVELAGAVAELSRYTLQHNFRRIDPATARILLIEGVDRVLPSFAPSLSIKAARSLAELGVTVRTNGIVTDITQESVTVRFGTTNEDIPTRTVMWAAGVAASPLGKILATATGAELDKVGRLIVGPDLSLPGHPGIFVIGDLASYSHQLAAPLPGLAPVAIQQGRYIARVLRYRRKGKPVPAFHYFDRGTMATIGRAKAVADVRGVHFAGLLAWIAWLTIHLMFLVQFQNRVLVMLQWAWNYTTRNSPARLITGRDAPVLGVNEENPPSRR